jgi:hypothetical protein
MFLVTTLGDKLGCFLVEELDPNGLTIRNIQYRNRDGGDWTGFYDFLRKHDGTVTGVRYAPLADDPAFLKSLKSKPYVRLLPNARVELYFSPDRGFVPELSADQDFGENMLLQSVSGEYAITFGLRSLTPAELIQIEALATNSA